jgi:UDP-glucose 4-epimerase
VKVAVTGASGFLGSYLTTHLAAQGHDVRALARTLPTRDANVEPHVAWLQGDLSSPHDAAMLVAEADAIVHLAWTNTPLTSNAYLPSDASANLLPTLALFEAVRAHRSTPHLVFASSGGAVYGLASDRRPFREDDVCRPQSSYGIQKLTIEQYLRMAADHCWLTATALRIGNPYGVTLPPERMQGFIGTAVAQLLAGDPIRVFGNPSNVRDYVHIADVCRAIELALKPRRPFDVLNIGSGTANSVEDVLRLIEAIVERPLIVEAQSSAAADDLLSWVVLDVAKAAVDLGWEPEISLREGVRRLITSPGSSEMAAHSPE